MSRFFSWRTLIVIAAGLVAAWYINQEQARRRRQAIPAGRVAPSTHNTPARPGPKPASAAPVSTTVAQQEPPEGPRWGIPRPVVAAAVAATFAAIALVAARGSGAPAQASISAEPVGTENGVLLFVRGEGFRPDADVRLYWQDAADGEVMVRATANGDVDALAALPDFDKLGAADAGSVDLVASDGVNEARTSFAVPPGSRSLAVLGAQASSRVLVNGSPYFLLGANYPWDSYGNDFGSNAWGSYGVHANSAVASQFADMKAKGVHVARWWVFADGRAGIDFASNGTPQGVQSAVYDDLDRALQIARDNNIYLDLVLFDVSLLGKPNTVNGVQMGGHSDLITSPTKRSALVNNVIKPLAQRYGANPNVLSWELMNEPEWAISDLPQAAVGSNYVPVTMAQFWAYASSASDLLHLSTTQQVTVGSAALKWNRVYTDAFATSKGLPPLRLDYYQTHYYQWMDCCSTNDPVLGTNKWSPLVQKAGDLGLDKPIVVGEVHTPAGAGGSVLDTLLGNGYAGVWGWSYNASKTGDKLTIDWPSFTAWEASHASIVRIPPTGGALPTATKPAASATATKTSTAPAATSTSAAATPTSVATTTVKFGRTSSSGVDDDSDWRYANGSNVRVDRAGRLQSLSVYVGATSPGARLRLALYTGTGSTGPQLLVAQTGEQAALKGWNTLAVSGGPQLAAGDYWILAQTDDAETVYREASRQPSTSLTAWAPLAYGAFPSALNGWARSAGTAFSMYGTLIAGATSTGGTPTPLPSVVVAAASPTPEMNVGTETVVPVNTATATPTRTPTAAPASPTPPPPATPTAIPTSSGSGCVTNCGTPRFFCDTGTWAFCDDYRDLYCPVPSPYDRTDPRCVFPNPGRAVSFDVLSSSDPGYIPSSDGQPTMGLSFFNQQEHFHTGINDGNFGEAVVRFWQPIDLTATRRIHFEADLKTGARRYIRLLISPQLTKAITDDRGEPNIESPKDGINLWFTGGPCANNPPLGTCSKENAFVVKNGNIVSDICCGSNIAGVDNVRNLIDVYVSRTRIKVVVDGQTYLDSAIADAGFDRGYVYMAQADYNSCKDGECADNLHIFHWDNVAFDGPVLPRNGLVPAGYQDVAFNAYSQGSCTVKGYPAVLQSVSTDLMWKTWVARMPVQSVGPADVSCSGGYRGDLWNGVPEGFEVVKQ